MKEMAGKVYGVCGGCGQIVRIDKPIIGGLHICTTEEERRLYPQQIAERARLAEQELYGSGMNMTAFRKRDRA